MANDPPPLALSDIMHPFTPSPSQEEDGEDSPLRSRSATPEPLDETQIEAIKSRVSELGISPSKPSSAASREQELADMVFKLSNSIRYDPSQLVAQAQTIHQLIQQREITARELEEERLRWDAERLGWSRMAEALIAKRRTGSGSFQQEEMDRHAASLQAENKSLRQRLSDTQSRLSTVESELMQLRPLLLLQPVALSNYQDILSIQHAQVSGVKQSVRRPHRRKDSPQKDKDKGGEIAVSEDEADELADDEEALETPKQNPKTVRPVKSSKGKIRSSHDKVTSLMADARAEHILLAARKLGRERVAYVSGIFAQQMDEHKTDRDELPSTSTPRTPKRSSAQVYPNFQSHTHPQAYVYLNSPAGPSPGVPVLVPIAHGPWPVPRTPMSPTKSVQRASSGTALNVQTTPLDSLVSAARSILDDDQSPSKLPAKRERVKKVLEDIDSPVPKKRRVTTVGLDGSRKSSSSSGRVRSALDVLADQAAVFSSQEKEKDDSAEPPAHEMTSGRGKERADDTRTGSGRRRSARFKKSLVDPQEESKNSDSSPTRYSYPANLVSPPSRSMSRTPPESLFPVVDIESSSGPLYVHEDGPTGFTSPPPGSSDVVHYHTRSSPTTFAARIHPHLGIDQMNAGLYTIESGEVISVNSSPGYPPGYGLVAGLPSADFTSQRGGARMTMDLGSSGMIPTKKKRADDKRAKTPYKKWSKEEDEVLAQAVAKYGLKWDQVQKALPERGYHQVRQRWLRRLRSVDHTRTANNISGVGSSTTLNGSGGIDNPDHTIAPNPKLGMAPLSSEKAVAAVRGYSTPPVAESTGRPPPTTNDPP